MRDWIEHTETWKIGLFSMLSPCGLKHISFGVNLVSHEPVNGPESTVLLTSTREVIKGTVQYSTAFIH